MYIIEERGWVLGDSVENGVPKKSVRRSFPTVPEARAGSFVYFIQEGFFGPVKIGSSKDVVKRIGNLQSGNAKELRFVAKICLSTELVASTVESSLHKRFQRFRIRGEWFEAAVLSRLFDISERVIWVCDVVCARSMREAAKRKGVGCL